MNVHSALELFHNGVFSAAHEFYGCHRSPEGGRTFRVWAPHAARVCVLVRDVEQQIYNSLEREVSSSRIGEMVMERLRNLDEVAYVRFASVYRSFCDINTFMEELKSLLSTPKE